MSIIEKIIEEKKKEILELKNLHGETLFSSPKKEKDFFLNSLKNNKYLSVIAEIKPKSPSHGEMIKKEETPEVINLYKKLGVNAISVLTDKNFFGGGYDLLKNVSTMVDIPLLAKDFIIDTIQIDMAILSGASAILLISDILDDKTLLKLYEYAKLKKINVLLEAHEIENIKRCINLSAEIIGINNRNLKTLKENLNHSIQVRDLLPEDIVKLSLSSIKSREDAKRVANVGYDGILIGSVIMKAFNKSAALNSFLKIEKEIAKVLEI